jgi:hypothetical protein
MEKRPTNSQQNPPIITLLNFIFTPIRFLFKALIAGISLLVLKNTLRK